MSDFNVTAYYFSRESKFRLPAVPWEQSLYEAYSSARRVASEEFRTYPDDPHLLVVVEEMPGGARTTGVAI
jgi:hypothetical protein